MKKVYFYLRYVILRTEDSNEYVVDDGYWECGHYGVIESQYYDSIEEAFKSKEKCDSYTSPIMEGWIKE